MRKRLPLYCLALSGLVPPAVAGAAPSGAALDARIRKIVGEALRAKDDEIAALKKRLQQLEQPAKPAETAAATPDVAAKLQLPQDHPAPAAAPVPAPAAVEEPGRLASLFRSLKRKVDNLVKANEDDLQIHGFFDVTASANDLNAHTDFADPMQTQHFNMNAMEVDIEYHFLDHFAGSVALDWMNNNYAFVGAAILDYHNFDDNVPARGRIFSKDGVHIQFGTFDIPFSTDYQYNATPDRLTVTTPITTQRIQIGTFNPNNMWAGWNATGFRVYGTWNQLIDYSAFITNSVYGSAGRSIGGRFGMFFGNNPYRLHRQDNPHVIDAGFSTLADWDKTEHLRNQVYAFDLTFNYEALQVISEVAWRQAYRPTDFAVTNFATSQAPANSDLAWHVTAILNWDQWIKHRVYTFARYGQWRPNYRTLCVNCDYQNPVADNENSFIYRVGPTDQLSLGLGYRFNDNFLLKFEYFTSLGTSTDEPYFEKRRTQAQLVVSF